jgi:predicted TIM-barrel fold metal-dependent hydrolase
MDYPYQYAPEEVGFLDHMNMSEADKMAFFQTNAEHVFKIPHAKP